MSIENLYSGEITLWQSVLLQAVLDVSNGKMDKSWFRKSNKDFNILCELSGFKKDLFLNNINNIGKNIQKPKFNRRKPNQDIKIEYRNVRI